MWGNCWLLPRPICSCSDSSQGGSSRYSSPVPQGSTSSPLGAPCVTKASCASARGKLCLARSVQGRNAALKLPGKGLRKLFCFLPLKNGNQSLTLWHVKENPTRGCSADKEAVRELPSPRCSSSGSPEGPAPRGAVGQRQARAAGRRQPLTLRRSSGQENC